MKKISFLYEKSKLLDRTSSLDNRFWAIAKTFWDECIDRDLSMSFPIETWWYFVYYVYCTSSRRIILLISSNEKRKRWKMNFISFLLFNDCDNLHTQVKYIHELSLLLYQRIQSRKKVSYLILAFVYLTHISLFEYQLQR